MQSATTNKEISSRRRRRRLLSSDVTMNASEVNSAQAMKKKTAMRRQSRYGKIFSMT